MLHKVKALKTYSEKNIIDAKYGKVLEEGFVFEVDDERLKVLKGDNKYKVAFVEEISETEEAPKPKKRKKKE